MIGALVHAVEDSRVNPGVLGFLVVALLGVATWLLLKSMTRHLRRVDFDSAGGGGADQQAEVSAEDDTGDDTEDDTAGDPDPTSGRGTDQP